MESSKRKNGNPRSISRFLVCERDRLELSRGFEAMRIPFYRRSVCLLLFIAFSLVPIGILWDAFTRELDPEFPMELFIYNLTIPLVIATLVSAFFFYFVSQWISRDERLRIENGELNYEFRSLFSYKKFSIPLSGITHIWFTGLWNNGFEISIDTTDHSLGVFVHYNSWFLFSRKKSRIEWHSIVVAIGEFIEQQKKTLKIRKNTEFEFLESRWTLEDDLYEKRFVRRGKVSNSYIMLCFGVFAFFSVIALTFVIPFFFTPEPHPFSPRIMWIVRICLLPLVVLCLWMFGGLIRMILHRFCVYTISFGRERIAFSWKWFGLEKTVSFERVRITKVVIEEQGINYRKDWLRNPASFDPDLPHAGYGLEFRDEKKKPIGTIFDLYRSEARFFKTEFEK